MCAVSAETIRASRRAASLLLSWFVGIAAHAAPQYAIVDLGTLGGTTSRAFAINDAGQVAGYAEDSTGRRHAFRSSPRWRQQALTDFASPEESGSIALAISSRGQITGYRELPPQAAIAELDFWREKLGLLPRSNLSINAAPPLPDIFSYQGFRSVVSVRRSRIELKYFRPSALVSSQTGTYLLSAEIGQGINRWGEVVGGRQLPHELGLGATIFSEHAFKTKLGSYSAPRGRDLGDLSDLPSTARGISDRGQVVGKYTVASSPFQHAFRSGRQRRQFELTDMGTLGGQNSEGRAINSRGQVTGDAETADSSRHAFRSSSNYDPPQLADLGTLGGKNSVGYAIDRNGVVVGSSDLATSSETHGFIFDDSGMHDLNPLIPTPQGWIVIDAVGINRKGEIAANGVDPAGRKHALLLQPMGGQ